ncbi:hypothetical protein KIW84_072769 [Lathyrus oleraceus]|uniref:Uncharacterized protein n=1 Tax=Pisum sativum TaxID=3888 RepID=A0A9D4ZWG2_PEA|nr:hypothetical protein KIW84_072769 [Pisum sativum]
MSSSSNDNSYTKTPSPKVETSKPPSSSSTKLEFHPALVVSNIRNNIHIVLDMETDLYGILGIYFVFMPALTGSCVILLFTLKIAGLCIVQMSILVQTWFSVLMFAGYGWCEGNSLTSTACFCEFMGAKDLLKGFSVACLRVRRETSALLRNTRARTNCST